GDAQETEEDGEAAQRLLSAPFERDVIDLIDRGAERVERRQDDDAGEDGIEAEVGIDDVSDVGAEDDEGRVSDVDDVENAEGDRDAGGDGGVEAAQHEAGDDRVDEE